MLPGTVLDITGDAGLANRMTSRLALAVALMLTAAVYWPGLRGPLVFDDAQNLVPLTHWLQGSSSWMTVVLGNHSGLFGRPVAMASFVLNIWLLGPQVWTLKLGNLVLHLGNGVLVYLLLAALARQEALVRVEPGADNRWLPVLGAAAWLLHPLLVSTVLYVVQRMAMLSALFTLLAMLAYLHGRMALADRPYRGRALLLLGVPLFTLLAALSKENGILAPALCGVIEFCVFVPRPGTRRPWPSVAFIIATLVLPALLAIGLTVSGSAAIVGDYANRPFTLSDRLLTQPRVLWDYVGSLVLPDGPRLGLYHDDYTISHGLLDPPSTTLALLGWMAVTGSAVALRRRAPGYTLGVGVFLVGHALESSVFPLLMYFEHRNYLPAVGAVWASISLIAYAMDALKHRMHHSKYVFGGGGIALIAVLALATAARVGVWQSEQTLLAQGLQYHPQSRWLRMDLARQAMHQQPPQWDEARRHIGAMLDSPDAGTRRLAAVARLLVDCSAAVRPQPAIVAGAFQGRPEPIEADVLVAFENLSEGVMTQPCPGFSALQMADALAGMLDRSTLPAGDTSMWRLRLKAAKLYLASNRSSQALHQARLAYAGGTAEASVPVFIAWILLQRGDNRGADKMLDAAVAHMAEGDGVGHAVVADYRARIQRARQTGTNQKGEVQN